MSQLQQAIHDLEMATAWLQDAKRKLPVGNKAHEHGYQKWHLSKASCSMERLLEYLKEMEK